MRLADAPLMLVRYRIALLGCPVMSTHRAPKEPNRLQQAAVTAGATGLLATVLATGSAHAATVSTWDRVAACESSGDWAVSTGNGYYGGLQFSASTWAAYGGHAYAGEASGATKAQQIAVAERVLAAQGPGAWPVCGPKAGLARGGPAPSLPVVRAKAAVAAVVRAPAVRTVSRAAEAVSFALSKRSGSGYLWGGTGPTRFDCSGLVQAAWKHAGVPIPRTAEAQLHSLPRVPLSHLQPGDIVGYFGGSHVAMYIGHGMVVGAENPSDGIRTMPLNWGRQVAQSAVRPSGSTQTTRTASAPAATVTRSPAPAVAPAVAMGGQYRVVPGDNLSEIAARHGVRGGWPALYAANRSVVGADPDLIFPDQVLRLP